jgi:hypothetical protein
MVLIGNSLSSFLVTAFNGDVIDLSGPVHTKANFRMTPSGNTVASLTSDYNLSGVGSITGVTYNPSQKVAERGMSTID